jgi:hypothetical protein
MTDPRSTDPRSGPVNSAPRGPNQLAPRNNNIWMISGLLALAVIAGVVWSMRDHDRTTATSPAPQTTGQSNQAPGGSPATTPDGSPATTR